MNDQLNDINLLPEDLRQEEEKNLGRKDSASASASNLEFHLPALGPSSSRGETREPAKPSVSAVASVPKEPARPEVSPLKKPAEPPKERVNLAGLKPKGKFFRNFFKTKKAEMVIQESKAKVGSASAKLQVTPLNRGLIDVNLIPEGTYLLPTKTMSLSLLTAVLVGLIFVFLGYLGLIFYGNYVNQQDQMLSQRIDEKAQEFFEYQTLQDEAGLWNQKLKIIGSLFNQHIYWTKVLAELEAVTIPEVYYNNISASVNGLINLSGVATSYTAVSRQFLALLDKPEIFTSVDVGGLSGDSNSGEISFSLILQLNPGVFYSIQNQ